MKKYTIFALALALCVTGLTGCRRNKGMEDGTIPSTTAAPTTQATTMPTTEATTIPTTTETRSNSSTETTHENMTDSTTPSDNARSRTAMPGVG